MVQAGVGIAILPQPICERLDKNTLRWIPLESDFAWALCDKYIPSRQIIPNCQCKSLSSGIQRSVFLSRRSQIGCGRMAIPTPASLDPTRKRFALAVGDDLARRDIFVAQRPGVAAML